MFKGVRAAFALMVAAILATGTAAHASTLQCAPYARQISGIQIFGNAGTWWSQAAGKYERGDAPRVGAVLVLSSSRAMPVGHVAMVSSVVNEREVLLNHANWSYRGGIERDVRAVDVSAAGDWSEVRIWHGPSRGLGIRTNPAYGFIYADDGKAAPVKSAPTQTAMASAQLPG